VFCNGLVFIDENQIIPGQRKKRRIEGLDDGWMTKYFFEGVGWGLVLNLTAQLNALNKELRGKDKLVTEMSDRIEAFKFKL
jgi:hypothetical protein